MSPDSNNSQAAVYRLFVYGSLRSGFHHPVYALMTRYFTLNGVATVQGKLYDMGDYPGAVPSQEAYYITGELYEINNAAVFDEAIDALDDYEGLHAEAGEMPLFRRDIVAVTYNGDGVRAWIYWYNRPVSDQPCIRSGDILQYRNSGQ